MVGQGKKVLMVQFLKGSWKSGEDSAIIRNRIAHGGNFKLKKMGRGFVGILGDKRPKKEHKKAAKDALEYAKNEISKYDLVILDEVNVAVSLGLLTDKEVLKIIKNLSEEKLVIFTGRRAPKSFIESADLVTEMKEIKHPFKKGKTAAAGVEF